LPNALWERKQHIIILPYEKDFNEKHILTKARPTQMNAELLEYCKKEIQNLLEKNEFVLLNLLGVVQHST